MGVVARLLLLSSLFALELIPISSQVRLGVGGFAVSGWLLAFAVLFLTFAYRPAHSSFRSLISSRLAQTPIAWRYLGGHLGAMLLLIGLATLPSAQGTPHLESFFVVG